MATSIKFDQQRNRIVCREGRLFFEGDSSRSWLYCSGGKVMEDLYRAIHAIAKITLLKMNEHKWLRLQIRRQSIKSFVTIFSIKTYSFKQCKFLKLVNQEARKPSKLEILKVQFNRSILFAQEKPDMELGYQPFPVFTQFWYDSIKRSCTLHLLRPVAPLPPPLKFRTGKRAKLQRQNLKLMDQPEHKPGEGSRTIDTVSMTIDMMAKIDRVSKTIDLDTIQPASDNRISARDQLSIDRVHWQERLKVKAYEERRAIQALSNQIKSDIIHERRQRVRSIRERAQAEDSQVETKFAHLGRAITKSKKSE